MKLRYLIILTSALFLLAACGAVTNEARDTHSAAPDGSDDRGVQSIEELPSPGMTQSQIREIYGEPDSVNRSPCCETWYYWFKDRRVFVPGQFRTRARNAVFIFGDNGKLKDFGYNQ